ncbi:hypothetical protein [Streptomyces lincolnensis]|uniref:hypothetical protein n=1 Tax=Streptomyces lincolnensis TaxID=1915 RepID=UPI0037D1FC5E
MTVESIPVQATPKSLVWQGDELVSAAGGGQASGHDGVAWEEAFAEIFFFDAGTTSASGRYSALYHERGLEGLLLERGEVVRELVRSDELPMDYDYPLALGALSDGREVVVHCPDKYNVLQIEDAASGERLTAGEREPQDVFHSRLSLSPDGRYLLSVGWVWHPFGVAMVYDMALALTDPRTLDGDGLVPTTTALNGEVTAGCWLDADRLVLATGTDGGVTDEAELPPNRLGVWSMSEGRWLHRSPIADAEPGVLLLPRGDQVVSFRGHPRLLDAVTGRLVAEWPEVGLPVKDFCYGDEDIPSPVAALHPDGTRLAVAQADSIALITLP